ncbi:signal peptidase I [Legionella pneumophila]|uniref:signal peptidase I n=1 Tax=Legionella pneumophila TaxID=446 RepID=UPI000770B620|nr:signal peptidase I [Legionella pneumophila]CZL27169.1 Signal peptidase I [Legionella pneumophila]
MFNFKPNTSRLLKEWIHFFIFAFCLFAGRSAVADWNRIPSGSMEPTLYIGDLILVNKLAYDLKVPFTTKHMAQWSNPKRGEIVVFYKPGDGQRLIKRVIGTPGDVIEMKNNCLIINGHQTTYKVHNKPLRYNLPKNEQPLAIVATEYLDKGEHAVMGLPSQSALRTFGPIKVPEGEFLMLGDNRDGSADSRYFGFVPRKQIVGRAERVIISWDKEDFYKPRFERFLQKLV